MPLDIFIGAAGAGKTKQVYEDLIRSSVEHPQLPHFVLVPEQFTLQTERRLVNMHPDHILMNIDVLSFNRLAYRVLEEKGIRNPKLMDETGKSMLLRRIAGRKDGLTVFSGSLGRAGFIHRMKTMLSEMILYGVTPERLQSASEQLKGHPMLQAKLHDLGIFYESLNTEREDGEILAEELPMILLRELADSRLLNGAVVALDSFTGFTPVQLQIISLILTQARSVSVTLTMPSDTDIYSQGGLFSLTKSTAVQLVREAQFRGINADIIRCAENPDSLKRRPALAFLERNFLRFNARGQYHESPDGLSITSCLNPHEQAGYLASEIRRLVREEGLRYSEIAVATGALDTTGKTIKTELGRAGIPVYMDDPADVLGHPLVVYILSAIEVLEKSFSYESVFRFLRSGIAELTGEEIDELDNYVFATGMRGVSKWQEEWTRVYDGADELDTAKINELKDRAAAPLFRLREALSSGPRTIAHAAQAVMDMISAETVTARLAQFEQDFTDQGDPVSASTYAQIREKVVGLLEQMSRLLGEETYNLKELKETLASGFGELKLGSVPPYIDQVLVGDIRRSRRGLLKALFILDMNEGVVPAAVTGYGILTDEEKRILRDCDIELSPLEDEEAVNEEFYLYSLLAQPSDRLYLSYCRLNSKGESLRSSSYISHITNMFPQLKISDGGRSLSQLPYSTEDALDRFSAEAALLRSGDPSDAWKELYLHLQAGTDPAVLDRIIDAAFFRYGGTRLSPEAAQALYGQTISGSVSMLETHMRCAYAGFLTYGLRLSERPEYSFKANDRGNLFHSALEYIFRKMSDEHIDPSSLDEASRNARVREGIEYAVKKSRNPFIEESARSEYFLDRWTRITDTAVWSICRQMEEAGFRPEAFELHFDAEKSAVMNIMLDDDHRMMLGGTIDRVDTMRDGDSVYIRIVDYKSSGSARTDLKEMYDGAQLQLMVYLDAITDLKERRQPGSDIVTGGVYYYNITDPTVDIKLDTTDEQLEAGVLKALRMYGLSNSSLKDTGVLGDTGGTMLTQPQFDLLRRHIRRRVRELGEKILSGDAEASPYGKDLSACAYCAFSGVCGYDEALPGYKRRKPFAGDDPLKTMEEEDGI